MDLNKIREVIKEYRSICIDKYNVDPGEQLEIDFIMIKRKAEEKKYLHSRIIEIDGERWLVIPKPFSYRVSKL